MYTDAHCHPFDLVHVYPNAEQERRRLEVRCAASSSDLEEFNYIEDLAKKAAADGAAADSGADEDPELEQAETTIAIAASPTSMGRADALSIRSPPRARRADLVTPLDGAHSVRGRSKPLTPAPPPVVNCIHSILRRFPVWATRRPPHVAHTTNGRRASRAMMNPRLTSSSVPSKSRSSCSMMQSPA